MISRTQSVVGMTAAERSRRETAECANLGGYRKSSAHSQLANTDIR